MSATSVPPALQNLLADLFDIPPDQVTPDLAAGSIEAWDSVGHLQAILALETEFGVQFDPESIPELTSVGLLQRELQTRGVRFA